MNVIELSQRRNCVEKKVLVVDDSVDARLLLRTRLHKQFPNLEIVEANSGLMASVELNRSKFDLVISDANMPDGDGFWLHYFMEQFHQATPMFFFTSQTSSVDRFSYSRKIFDKVDIKGLLDSLNEHWKEAGSAHHKFNHLRIEEHRND